MAACSATPGAVRQGAERVVTYCGLLRHRCTRPPLPAGQVGRQAAAAAAAARAHSVWLLALPARLRCKCRCLIPIRPDILTSSGLLSFHFIFLPPMQAASAPVGMAAHLRSQMPFHGQWPCNHAEGQSCSLRLPGMHCCNPATTALADQQGEMFRGSCAGTERRAAHLSIHAHCTV